MRWSGQPKTDERAARGRDERGVPDDSRADRRAGLPAGALRRRRGGRAAARRHPPRRPRRGPGRTAPAHRAGLHRRAEKFGHQQLGDHEAPHRRRPARLRLLRAHPRHGHRHADGPRTRRLGRGRPPDCAGMGQPAPPGARRVDAGHRRSRWHGRRPPARRPPRCAARAAAGVSSATARPPPATTSRRRWPQGGARVLDYQIETEGLRFGDPE